MSIIRRRDKATPSQKMGIKKIASVQTQEPQSSFPKLNLNSGHKTTLVSGIVDQLIKSGYKGDLLSSAGMTYAHPDTPDVHVSEDRENIELVQDMIVEDIDFESKEKEIPTEEMSPAEIKKRNAAILEERTQNSQECIKMISKNARTMYGHIDTFISSLREAAEKTSDNPRLAQKLENLRRICIGFVRNVDQQMPNYATSLFVNTEENKNV